MPNGSSIPWLRDRNDPRVIAALDLTCTVCKAPPRQDCGWVRDEDFTALQSGVIHAIRVPKKILFGGSK